MAFKLSNETKVGALTAISITLLILGFNFLKGKNLTKKSRYLFAKFEKIDGLVAANPVLMNGLSIGSVYTAEPGDAGTIDSGAQDSGAKDAATLMCNPGDELKDVCYQARTIQVPCYLVSRYLDKGATLGKC